jgi:hypothetical protein
VLGVQKGKEMTRTGQEQGKNRRHHYSTLAGITHYKGDMKWRHTILTHVSLYTERETRLLSLLKGDTSLVMRVSLYVRNRRCAILTHISILSEKQVHLRY